MVEDREKNEDIEKKQERSLRRLGIHIDSCPYPVKPFPFAFCQGCMFNGCYPWNRNPLLLCSRYKNGFFIAPSETDDEGVVECLSYKPVTERAWLDHIEDLKREAKDNEEVRDRAMRGKAYSSELLPAETVAHTRRRRF